MRDVLKVVRPRDRNADDAGGGRGGGEPRERGRDGFAMIGASLGIGVGMFVSLRATQALTDEGIVFAVPYGSLLVFVSPRSPPDSWPLCCQRDGPRA